MRTWNRRRPARIGLPMVVISMAIAMISGPGAGSARAQDDVATLHPVHIHTGTCDDLGDVVVPLSDVGSGAVRDGTPVAAAEPTGPESAIPVLVSMTTVDLPLADIVDGGHAINIHESADNIGNYIACGDIGGAMMGDSLVIGLAELNDSGAFGIALLEDSGDQTRVSIYLTQTGASAETGAATTTDETSATTEVAVDIVNFTYDPDPVEITAGDTITWTNQDAEPHTATALDRDLLQTGTLRGGDTASQTFAEPGTYEYFCEFHANMAGMIIVE